MCRRWSLRRWSSQASNNVYGSALMSIEKDVAVAAAAVAASAGSAAAPKIDKPTRNEGRQLGQLSLLLTAKFMAVVLLLSTTAAFTAGCIARIIILSKFDALPMTLTDHHFATQISATVGAAAKIRKSSLLPAPTVIPGKDVPFTTYTSKTFQIEGSATSHTLHIDRRNAARKVTSKVNEDLVAPMIGSEEVINLQCMNCASGHSEGGVTQKQNVSAYTVSHLEDEEGVFPINDYNHNDDSDGLHLPAGQHLLVDIKDVDSAFLNSEERLATAMVELIKESQLTLLSYHCHSLVPIGVSCAGVLLESHVAFHTWPKEGVITMDLFTCGGNPLIPVLSSIQKLFGIPRTPLEDEDEQDIPEPTMLWSHKLRGFREGFAPGYDRERNSLDQDLGRYTLGKLDFDVKDQIVSTKTAFQSVDVYDLLNPGEKSMDSYLKSLSNDGSYESNHPEQFGPNRVLYLDGVIQSTLYGDAPYHESIVHPAMITHPNPKRVAVIGGGEGATLREVLKHNTVEEAVMIEIDEGVVELSKENLPQWQDCSDIAHHTKAAEWCFDDARVRTRFEDAMAYFVDNFSDGSGHEEASYDIIIMDALDPNDDIEFAVELYTSDIYIRSLYNALTTEGILVVQVGEAPYQSSPADETGRFANRSAMKEELARAGFKSIHVYEESHSGFLAPWSTLVAFRDIHTREYWYRNAAEIEVQLQKRILRSKSGDTSLRYFDGATMSSYQLPPSSFEAVHCRQEEAPTECGGSAWPVEAAANETNKVVAYNPVVERRNREVLHSREYALGNIDGWKEVLLN